MLESQIVIKLGKISVINFDNKWVSPYVSVCNVTIIILLSLEKFVSMTKQNS